MTIIWPVFLNHYELWSKATDKINESGGPLVIMKSNVISLQYRSCFLKANKFISGLDFDFIGCHYVLCSVYVSDKNCNVFLKKSQWAALTHLGYSRNTVSFPLRKNTGHLKLVCKVVVQLLGILQSLTFCWGNRKNFRVKRYFFNVEPYPLKTKTSEDFNSTAYRGWPHHSCTWGQGRRIWKINWNWCALA